MNREQEETLPIIIALITAIAPHTPGLPLWINLWCLALWGYMLIRLKTGWPLPSSPVRYTLTFISILGLLATFRVRIGGDAFVGLLALMAAIKPFEMPTHRHRMITILLTYFIIITSLFRSDSLFILLYMVFSVFVTTTALVRINLPSGDIRKSARLAFVIQAGAIPLVLVLFLVFPRLPGSLVGLEDRTMGKTGFSDQLSPGSISRLIQDQTPAFRVDFEEKIPNAAQLYWRGIVFNTFDGRTWKSLPERQFRQAPEDQGKTIAYTVLLPPDFSRRLMALDRPVQGPAWSRISRDHTMISLKKIVQKTAYRAVSKLPEGGWSAADKSTEKPFIFISGDTPNPLARNLARELGKGVSTPGEKAAVLISYLKENRFSYSTSPPLLSGPPVDAFLFNSRTGYCEHYASAFAFMMNAMGVPARVVAGYLGGELNPYGNYLIVRKAYAHAWAEYYDAGRGWVRADPTLAVKPDRLMVHPDGSAAGTGRTALSFFQKTGFVLDAVNLKWETWFTGYSFAEQQAWLRLLGLARKGKAAGALLVVLTLLSLSVFLGLLVYVMKQKRDSRDPVTRAYDLFLKKLAGTGVSPGPGQGPVEFSALCMDKRPDLKSEIQSIMDLYVDLRYKKQTRTSPRDFAASVRAFRPGSRN